MLYRLIPAAFAIALALFFCSQAFQDWKSTQLLQESKGQQENFDFDLSIQTLQRAMALEPRSAELHLETANAYRVLYKFRKKEDLRLKAEQEYLQASRLNPSSALIPYQQALMYSWTGDPRKALEPLQKSIELDPNNGGYWLELGIYLEQLKEPQQALEAYVISNQRMPSNEAAAAIVRLKGQP